VNQTDLFVLGILVGGILFWQVYKWWRALRLKRKVVRARRGEERALHLLESEGYEIVELQKRTPVVAKVDGKEYKTYIAADALVRKHGRTYVAEIKTGSEATRITHAPTRRQILEYFCVFRPHGILLVDMEQEKIRTVEFTMPHADNRIQYSVLLFLAVFIFGVICGFQFRGGF
jgi:hypothetical protein